MKKLVIIFFLALLSALASEAAQAATKKQPKAKRDPQIQSMIDACVKNIEKPKVRKERIAICDCLGRNHEKHTPREDWKTIESLYDKTLKESEPADDQLSVLLDFDLDLAEECLKDSKYTLEK